tara:strand:- start:10 stop:369 length:360 start_codon:yes stop_codon:yes gene_type:complete
MKFLEEEERLSRGTSSPSGGGPPPPCAGDLPPSRGTSSYYLYHLGGVIKQGRRVANHREEEGSGQGRRWVQIGQKQRRRWVEKWEEEGRKCRRRCAKGRGGGVLPGEEVPSARCSNLLH